MGPAVSVITPLYKAAVTLADAVASVRAQTLTDWEMVAADDASPDDSAARFAALTAQDHRFRLVRLPVNGGPGAARNAAMAAATGRFIAFLDADDLWHPEKLARQVRWMDRTGHAITCTAFVRRSVGGTETPVGVPEVITRGDLLRTNVMACSSVIIDRARLGDRRMPVIRRRQDYAFWLAILADWPQAGGLPEPLTVIRQQAQSVSSSKLRAALATWAAYRGDIGLTRGAAARAFASYAVQGAARHYAPGLARWRGWIHPVMPIGGFAPADG
jgi:teichuronic acid biosynthesis glycosyltransferase TuaG